MFTIVDNQVELLFTQTATQSSTVQHRAKNIYTFHNSPSCSHIWLVLDNLQQLMECESNVSSMCRLAYSIPSLLDFL